jgi:hypothetical protein
MQKIWRNYPEYSCKSGKGEHTKMTTQKKIMRHFPQAAFSVLAFIPALNGCFSPAPENRPASSALNLDSVPSLPTVDAAQLKISDIVVAQFNNPKLQGAVQPYIDFRYSGSTDYVEAKTCIEATGACVDSKNIFENNATLANAPDGSRVIVKLRACVNPGRSSGSSNCGPWFEKEYTQWAAEDKSKSALVEEYEAIEREVKNLDKQLKAVLNLLQVRAEKCKPASAGAKDLLDAEKGMITAITKLGGGIVGAIGKKLTESPPAKPKAEASPATTEPVLPPATTIGTDNSVIALTSENSLSLSGGSSNKEIIVAQAKEHLPKIFKFLGDALKKKSEAQKKLADEKSATPAAAPEAAGSSPASGAAAEKAAQTLTKAAADGPFKWAPIIDALPSLAEGIFDLSNADRKVAQEGICVDALSAKQGEAIEFAKAEAGQSILRLSQRLQSVRAKIGGKP